MPYGDPDQQAKANKARANRVAGKDSHPWVSFQNWIDKASTGGRNQKPIPGNKPKSAPSFGSTSKSPNFSKSKNHQDAAKRKAERMSEGYKSRKSTTAEELGTAKYNKHVLNNSPKLFKNDAKSRAKNNETAFKNYRAKRIAEGDYKGKYYGPDEFKGDTKKLAAWRAAGSPKDKSKYA